MAAQSLQFLDMDGFWGEIKTSEERYYSDSFMSSKVLMKMFYFQQWQEGLCTKEEKNPQFKMDGDPKTIMEGARAFESVDIVSQQTHFEPTNAIDVDVTPTCKGLDKAN